MLDSIQFYPLLADLVALVLAAGIGAAVQAMTERMLNRWVPEPRLATPDPEYIL